MKKFELVKHITDVVEKNGKKSYRYYSEIKCRDCGHTIKIAKGDMRRYFSCDKCNLEALKLEFVGYKNDMYEVLSFSRKSKRHVFYNVKCNKCGKITEMRKDSIKDNKKVSCIGCKGNGRKPKVKSVYNIYKYVYETGATQRSLSWELTDQQFIDLVSQDCYYCGDAPVSIQSLKRYNKTKENVFVNGIDRLNSSEGYNLNNCVPCCSMCNRMKMAFSEKDFLNQISKIHKKHMCSTTIETTVNTEKGVEYTQVGGNGESPNEKDVGCDIV